MGSYLLPSLEEVRQVFAEEVTQHEGEVTDAFIGERGLFLRAVLPQFRHVAPGDPVHRGVALRACHEGIDVHPYTFRQVCRNGAILPEAVHARRVERLESSALPERVDAVLDEVRAAVREGASEEVFAQSTHAMRRAIARKGSVEMLIALIGSLPDVASKRTLVATLLDEFDAAGDRSQFGVMNAITAVARQTRDPETRWRLEELGGGSLAVMPKAPTPLDTAVGCH